MSGGHLCEAEAPTEPACETAARRAAIRSKSPVIAKPCKRLWQSVFLLKGITDSFTLRVQNDKSFSHCKYIRRAAIRFSPPRHCEHRKVRGNPFSFKREIRILSCYALRMTNRLVATNAVRCAVSCRSVIAKPCKRLWQSVFFSSVIASAERRAAIRFPL